MIEFIQSAAPWLGYAVMALGSGVVLALLACFALDRVFKAIGKAHGMAVVWAALRAWHKANPGKSRGGPDVG